MAFRGLFIIDGKGVLRQITVNDLPVGRDVDETLRLIQAFQFTDEHGKLKIKLIVTLLGSGSEWPKDQKTATSDNGFLSKKINEN